MSAGGLRVLIVGGYGTFGGRLAELLADEPRLTLLIAGRSMAAAEAFCRRPSYARLVPAVFDRTGVLEGQLLDLKPGLVVDASGPFQDYGGDPYALARAAIACGADYIDLADAAAFVDGIGMLDKAAREVHRFALSGASSFPVLTAAVVRRLAKSLTRVERIEAGIARSRATQASPCRFGRAARGLAVRVLSTAVA
jgi:saccharopine dehydrogenase-like NADP-dependent oxidoreductase